MAPLFLPVAIYDDFMCPVVRKRPRMTFPVSGFVCGKRRCPDPLTSWLIPFDNLTSSRREKFVCGENGFEAQIDLRGFDAKDVKVKVDKKSKMMKISAKKEEERNGVKSVRNVERCFALPEGHQAEGLQSEMGADGLLKVTCPVNKALQKVEENQHQGQERGQEQPKDLADEKMDVEHTADKEDKENGSEVEVQVQKQEEEKKESEAEADPGAEEEVKVVEVKEKPFEFTVNVSDYNPDNLSVDLNLDERMIIVKATEEEEKEDGSVITKQMTKKMTFDVDLFDVDQIKSELSDIGVLRISAPRRFGSQGSKSRTIPINQSA